MDCFQRTGHQRFTDYRRKSFDVSDRIICTGIVLIRLSLRRTGTGGAALRQFLFSRSRTIRDAGQRKWQEITMGITGTIGPSVYTKSTFVVFLAQDFQNYFDSASAAGIILPAFRSARFPRVFGLTVRFAESGIFPSQQVVH